MSRMGAYHVGNYGTVQPEKFSQKLRRMLKAMRRRDARKAGK